jgi:tripartite-type tricarboxylate transporter receptor subunit TctC
MQAIAAAVIASILASLSVALTHAADAYPARPIRLIMPQAPGSSNDTIARITSVKLSELLGQQIVIDNRAGAGGILGAEIAARATPDGYTLFSGGAPSHAVAPITYKKLPYDPVKDFTPISLFAIADMVLCVNPGLPAKSVKEFVALARSKPGQLNMASAGTGSVAHLGGAMFTALTDIKSTHVPYKGGAANVIAVASGEAHWLISPVSALMGQIKSGRLRALAVGGKTRSSFLPELPTLQESGIAGYEFYTWTGLMTPAGTSPAIVNRLHEAMVKSLTSADVKAQLMTQGVEPAPSRSPVEFSAFILNEQRKMRELAKVADLKAE